MLTSKFLDDLASRIGDAIKASPAKDIEKNVRAALGSVFNRLDLVTRDEFEVQAQLLLRTRERLAQLEEKLRMMEGGPAAGMTGAVPPGPGPGVPGPGFGPAGGPASGPMPGPGPGGGPV